MDYLSLKNLMRGDSITESQINIFVDRLDKNISNEGCIIALMNNVMSKTNNVVIAEIIEITHILLTCSVYVKLIIDMKPNCSLSETHIKKFCLYALLQALSKDFLFDLNDEEFNSIWKIALLKIPKITSKCC